MMHHWSSMSIKSHHPSSSIYPCCCCACLLPPIMIKAKANNNICCYLCHHAAAAVVLPLGSILISKPNLKQHNNDNDDTTIGHFIKRHEKVAIIAPLPSLTSTPSLTRKSTTETRVLQWQYQTHCHPPHSPQCHPLHWHQPQCFHPPKS